MFGAGKDDRGRTTLTLLLNSFRDLGRQKDGTLVLIVDNLPGVCDGVAPTAGSIDSLAAGVKSQAYSPSLWTKTQIKA